jgi:uncharacterized coiled-coil DUF342 family protein
MDPRTEAEQDLAEFKAMKRAEFAFRQKVERLRWERDELAPAVQEYVEQLNLRTAERVELPK